MKEIKLTLVTAILTFTSALIITPPLSCLSIFYMLYFIEEKSLPWLTFILGPLISVIILIIISIWILKAAKSLNSKHMKILKIIIYSSIIWGTLLIIEIFPIMFSFLQP